MKLTSVCLVAASLLLCAIETVYAGTGTVQSVKGRQAVVEFDHPPVVGEAVEIPGEIVTSGKVTRVKGNKAAVLFDSPPKTGDVVQSVAATRDEKGTVSTRAPYLLGYYSTQDNFNLQIPFGNWSAGLSYGSQSSTQTQSGISLTGKITLLQGKFGYWQHSIGRDGFYGLFGIGASSSSFTGSATSGTTTLTITAAPAVSYYSLQGGYQWFWDHLNAGLGLYYLNTKFADFTTNISGTTFPVSGFSTTTTGADLRVGFTY